MIFLLSLSSDASLTDVRRERLTKIKLNVWVVFYVKAKYAINGLNINRGDYLARAGYSSLSALLAGVCM